MSGFQDSFVEDGRSANLKNLKFYKMDQKDRPDYHFNLKGGKNFQIGPFQADWLFVKMAHNIGPQILMLAIFFIKTDPFSI